MKFVVLYSITFDKEKDIAYRVAKKLVKIRKERNFTQEDVRFDLGMNIGRIETGVHCVTLPVLERLCRYYKITLEEFFKGIDLRDE